MVFAPDEPMSVATTPGTVKQTEAKMTLASTHRNLRWEIVVGEKTKCRREYRTNPKPVINGTEPRMLSTAADAVSGGRTHITRMLDRVSRTIPKELTMRALQQC